ncbi:MAG TPA: hypothetical protein VN775_01080 [Opitutaceae bacterium]|nr:hypothetical protein [Opitutaceae bacterium]
MNTERSHLNVRGLIRHGLHLDDEAGLTDEERLMRHRRRVEVLIYFCWGLIVLKSFVVVWAVNHYAMPFNPMWVIAPTVTFAFVATSAYYWLRD